jgi:exopolyphosphatase/guanosine-5'-triphosphate,3'-diphosphate pyrophosphatase
MPGFPRAEQRFLATLIRSQRHRVEGSCLDELPKAWRQAGLRLVVILRLAVLLNRSRNDAELPPMAIAASEDGLSITIDADWLADNPLTVADLEREQELLLDAGYRLIVS